MLIYSQRNWQRLKTVINNRFTVGLVAILMLLLGGLYAGKSTSNADVSATRGYSVSTVYQYYLLSTNKNQLVTDSSDAKVAHISSGALGAGNVSGEFGYNDIINSASNKTSAKEFVTEMSTYSFYHYWDNQVFGFDMIKQMTARFFIGLLFLPFALVVDSINLVIYGMIGLIAKANVLVLIGKVIKDEGFDSKLAEILGIQASTVNDLINALMCVAVCMILLALWQMLKHGSSRIDQRGAHKLAGRLFSIIGLPILVVMGAYIINSVGQMVQNTSLSASMDLRSIMVDDRAWAYRQNFAPTGDATGGQGQLKSDGHNGSWVAMDFNPYKGDKASSRILNINKNSGDVATAGGNANNTFSNSSLVLQYMSCSTFDAQDYLSYEGSEQSADDHAVGSYYNIARSSDGNWLVDKDKIYDGSGSTPVDSKKGPGDDTSYVKAISDYTKPSHSSNKSLGNDASTAWRDRFVWGAKTGGDNMDKYYNASPSIEQIICGVGGSSAGALGGYQMSTPSMFYILSTNFNATGGRYDFPAPARGVLKAKASFDSNRSTYYNVSLAGVPFFSLFMMMASMITMSVVLFALAGLVTSIGFVDMNTRPLKSWIQGMTLGDIEYAEATIIYSIGIAGTIIILAVFPPMLMGAMNMISNLVFAGVNFANHAAGGVMTPTADEAYNGMKKLLESIVVFIFGYAYFKNWNNLRGNIQELLSYPWSWAKMRGAQLERQAGGNIGKMTAREAKRLSQPTRAAKAVEQLGSNTLSKTGSWMQDKLGVPFGRGVHGLRENLDGMPDGGDGTERSIADLAQKAHVTPAQQAENAVKGKHQVGAKRINEVPGNESGHGGYVDKTYADGTEIQEYDDGTAAIKNPDGTISQINPDGSRLTLGQDGSKIMESPDGTVTTYDPETGDTITRNPDGLQKVEHRDGSVEYQNADGTPYDGPVVDDNGQFTKAMVQKLDLPTQQQALQDLKLDPNTPAEIKPDIDAAQQALQRFEADPTPEHAQAAQDALNNLHGHMQQVDMDPASLQQVQNQADKLQDYANPVKFSSAMVSPNADPRKAVSDLQESFDNLKANPTAENAQKLQDQLIAMQPMLANDPQAQAQAANLAKALTPATEASNPQEAKTALQAARVDQLGNQLTDRANQDIQNGTIKTDGDIKTDSNGVQSTGNPAIDKNIGNLDANNFKADNLNADGTIKGDPNALTNQLSQALANGMNSNQAISKDGTITKIDPVTGQPTQTHLDANGNAVQSTGKLDTSGIKIDPNTGRPLKADLNNPNVSAHLDADGNPIRPDMAGQSIKAQLDGNGNPVQTHLDADGNPVKTQMDANGNPVKAQLDVNGQPLKTTVQTDTAPTINPAAGAQTIKETSQGAAGQSISKIINGNSETNASPIKTTGNVQTNGNGGVKVNGGSGVQTNGAENVKVNGGSGIQTNGNTTVKTGNAQTINPNAGVHNSGDMSRQLEQAVRQGMNGTTAPAGNANGSIMHGMGNSNTTNETINRINNNNTQANHDIHTTNNTVQRGADTSQLQNAVQNGMNSSHPTMRMTGGNASDGMSGMSKSIADEVRNSMTNVFNEATQSQNQAIANAIQNSMGNVANQNSQLQQSIQAIGRAKSPTQLNAAVHDFGAKLNALSPQQKQGINFDQLNDNVHQLRNSLNSNPNGEHSIGSLK